MDDAVARIHRAADAIDPVLCAVTADQLDRPTPCRAWDLRALVDHLLGNLHSWADRIEGRAPALDGSVLAHTNGDVAAAWRPARTALLDAVDPPGALQREITMPTGARGSAGFLAAILPIELMLHGWDVARSVGASTDLDPALADALLEQARGLMEGRPRGPELAFGEEQPAPPSATAADRLAAFYGRQV
jgi:uncharacterized protein (TIGR03086 family)